MRVWALFALLTLSAPCRAELPTYDELLGYHNVRVVRVTQAGIRIMHSSGYANIGIERLPVAVRSDLGISLADHQRQIEEETARQQAEEESRRQVQSKLRDIARKREEKHRAGLAADRLIMAKAVEIARRQAPDDWRMQKLIYDTQLSAGRYISLVEDAEIRARAQRQWPDDYAMQKHAYDTQHSARGYMAKVRDAELRQIAQRQWPTDYTMQKHAYDTQLSAKTYMATVSDTDVKTRVQRQWPTDYAMQKYSYNRLVFGDK